jgi:hypothetical protein
MVLPLLTVTQSLGIAILAIVALLVVLGALYAIFDTTVRPALAALAAPYRRYDDGARGFFMLVGVVLIAVGVGTSDIVTLLGIALLVLILWLSWKYRR